MTAGQTPLDLDLVNEVLDGDPLLTLAEAAAELNIAPETLRQNKKIQRIKMGHLRYRTSVIAAEKARRAASRAR